MKSGFYHKVDSEALPEQQRESAAVRIKKAAANQGGRIRDGQSPGLLTISPSADPAICNFWELPTMGTTPFFLISEESFLFFFLDDDSGSDHHH